MNDSFIIIIIIFYLFNSCWIRKANATLTKKSGWEGG